MITMNSSIWTRSVVAVAALLALPACNLEQPPLGCPVQKPVWAVRYVLKPGQTVTGACAEKTSERLGMERFDNPQTGTSILAIKPELLAILDADAPDTLPYASGAFPQSPNEGDFCVAQTFSKAEKLLPASGGDPEFYVSYEWSNVKVIATADIPGTQMVGDVTYTEDDCSANYEAWAVFPSVICAVGGEPSDAQCYDDGRINPDFDVICDPNLLRCVPAQRPPSLK
jgi:hypothetical protein